MIIKVVKYNENTWMHVLPKSLEHSGLSFIERWNYLDKLCREKFKCSLHEKYREAEPWGLNPTFRKKVESWNDIVGYSTINLNLNE